MPYFYLCIDFQTIYGKNSKHDIFISKLMGL